MSRDEFMRLCELPSPDIGITLLDKLDKPKGVQDLDLEVDTPIATIYRYVNILEEHDLIEIDEVKKTASGSTKKFYKRKVDEFHIELENNRDLRPVWDR